MSEIPAAGPESGRGRVPPWSRCPRPRYPRARRPAVSWTGRRVTADVLQSLRRRRCPARGGAQRVLKLVRHVGPHCSQRSSAAAQRLTKIIRW